ncbi:50S ribosomal protein L2 [Thiohalorhabdus denitrificans]|uniref:Large ribosomal subunit protein uL2 n=1 Tax=Thiohalorhabdus denitrificans TaxID=381306 RepID=A0A0N8PNA2_9GAMM|nr:50S ribosomal protein L2 [Thiohalorhabdus denitrificans]KPV40957.1 50S ribosomal protein L2 [Thiohalorhabdus denitrificans]SCY43372.1 large subunit ribosomal protein L2 [Thiohalorhabdus denitrificans]
MPTKKRKPTSPGSRYRITVLQPELHKGEPEKSLIVKKTRTDGRNDGGRISVRRRGGAHKRRLRIVDFKRDKDGIPGRIERLEYDPNRSAHLALVVYGDGEKRYIIAPRNIKVGDQIQSGEEAPIRPANCLPIRNIPTGTVIHNVELKPGKGGQIARSAGASAQLLAREGREAQIRMASGEVRRVSVDCRAVIGEVGNSDHANQVLGKAGASRWRGHRPKVRGVSMNPVDHPHGGGEGHTKGGRHPVTPWGQPTKGHRTRNNKRTEKLIVRRRKKK